MKPQIPDTDSIAALARFWDRVAERDAVRRMAAARGVAESALIHEWVKEKLHA